MSEFDPYQDWLEIPPEEQPANHYRLLGIALWETDPEVIRAAAEKRTTYLKTKQPGPQSNLAQKLKNEIAAAKLCLLNAAKKMAYDGQLESRLTMTLVPPLAASSRAASGQTHKRAEGRSSANEILPTLQQPQKAPPDAGQQLVAAQHPTRPLAATLPAAKSSTTPVEHRQSARDDAPLSQWYSNRSIWALAVLLGSCAIVGITLLWQKAKQPQFALDQDNSSSIVEPSSNSIDQTLLSLPSEDLVAGTVMGPWNSSEDIMGSAATVEHLETVLAEQARGAGLPPRVPDKETVLAAGTSDPSRLGGFSASGPASLLPGNADWLQVGTTWTDASGTDLKLTVTARNGADFTGLLWLEGGSNFAITGSVQGKEINWTAQRNGDEYSGEVAGGKIRFCYRGTNGNMVTGSKYKVLVSDNSPYASPATTQLSAYGNRGAGVRAAMLQSGGGTKQTERCVAAALNWLARHQKSDGSWRLLIDFADKCKDGTCRGGGSIDSAAAATALALLPFLAAGQSHQSKGPYQKNVQAGLYWFTSHQKNDGDLSSGGQQQMYTHGIATLAMCEAYGLSRDRTIGEAAQRAIQFIERAQNAQSGGWRYAPGEPGDTSVFGWQFMALKSAQMAGLTVSSQTLAGARRWLKAAGNGSGQFSYQPAGEMTPSMTAVGLLSIQHLGAARRDPFILGGQAYLMSNMPNSAQRNCYYWYYASQAMHNMLGYEWDTWNRRVRNLLIESQATKGCAAGSWSPDNPTKDVWGEQGGRLMVTSLSCLTLQVYYRYSPVYGADVRHGEQAAAKIAPPAPPQAMPPPVVKREPVNRPTADFSPFQSGTIWESEDSSGLVLHVADRSGTSFRARFVGVGSNEEAHGTISDNRVVWQLDKFVRGTAIYSGTITRDATGYKMTVVSNRTFELRLRGSK